MKEVFRRERGFQRYITSEPGVFSVGRFFKTMNSIFPPLLCLFHYLCIFILNNVLILGSNFLSSMI